MARLAGAEGRNVGQAPYRMYSRSLIYVLMCSRRPGIVRGKEAMLQCKFKWKYKLKRDAESGEGALFVDYRRLFCSSLDHPATRAEMI